MFWQRELLATADYLSGSSEGATSYCAGLLNGLGVAKHREWEGQRQQVAGRQACRCRQSADLGTGAGLGVLLQQQEQQASRWGGVLHHSPRYGQVLFSSSVQG